VLIGEPGVGKTAVVEGLAQRIVAGDVPEVLRPSALSGWISPPWSREPSIAANLKDRLKAVLKEITESDGQIILFIDELHTLVARAAAEGAMDASNMLKPALARGELRAIGATTLTNIAKYIEKDPALERRFQPVLIAEPSVEDTIAIFARLEGTIRIASRRAHKGRRHPGGRLRSHTATSPTGSFRTRLST